MDNRIQMLDCTLRDGAYIVDAKFGVPAIKGIIRKMQDANIEMIECGWLKNTPHQDGSSFFHVPSDLKSYISEKSKHTIYLAMIDWDRYDLKYLPENDGQSVDAIRVVFPREKFPEGIAVGKEIKKRGYQVFFQAANTSGYCDEELYALAEEINQIKPVCLSVVDTFGVMYAEDLEHIISILDSSLDKDIKLGFHSHNNQQLSFSLTMAFVRQLEKTGRNMVVDASLCGMGRGAGNATTELVASFLNRKYHCNYDMNVILDAIDTYMVYFQENYKWGYSTPYFIAGMYGAHVNNIMYLLDSHRTNARAMRNIIESLPPADRKKYDYDLLEQKLMDYLNSSIDDEAAMEKLQKAFADRIILLLFPGKSVLTKKEQIKAYIDKYQPVVVGINSVLREYTYDYLFFSNQIRYDYIAEVYTDVFQNCWKILASSIKTQPGPLEMIVNYNFLVKRGWQHSDNAGIMFLRLLNRLHIRHVAVAGFDGFGDVYADTYADAALPYINPGKKWQELNEEIRDMYVDFRKTTKNDMDIMFLTESKYNAC